MDNKTSSLLNGKLNDDEYGEFYAGYIRHSRGQNLFLRFDEGRKQIKKLVAELDDDQALYRYEKGKWSIKEVLGHLTDTERIMGYRALCFARNDSTELPGYDHDQYVAEANFDDRQLRALFEDYETVRSSTISLFQSFTDQMLQRRGTASGNPFSVRALGFVIAGHEIHHLDIIREKYLAELGDFSSFTELSG